MDRTDSCDTSSVPEPNRTFPWKSSLNSEKKSRNGRKPLSCPDCDKIFNCKSDLENHARTHTGEKPLLVLNVIKDSHRRAV